MKKDHWRSFFFNLTGRKITVTGADEQSEYLRHDVCNPLG